VATVDEVVVPIGALAHKDGLEILCRVEHLLPHGREAKQIEARGDLLVGEPNSPKGDSERVVCHIEIMRAPVASVSAIPPSTHLAPAVGSQPDSNGPLDTHPDHVRRVEGSYVDLEEIVENAIDQTE
jgi:hypothetical protein